ncbi:unnamed protein product [Sphenostylis stenocarpa]|uniref:Uncharacterized protein n=1 Tax=Sphenostylis stenocarpa TaxID=92480 RepID=A0AA86SMD8_9FABA|nr:unnamed protein product [Sphenostylis stenocarpa]
MFYVEVFTQLADLTTIKLGSIVRDDDMWHSVLAYDGPSNEVAYLLTDIVATDWKRTNPSPICGKAMTIQWCARALELQCGRPHVIDIDGIVMCIMHNRDIWMANNIMHAKPLWPKNNLKCGFFLVLRGVLPQLLRHES